MCEGVCEGMQRRMRGRGGEGTSEALGTANECLLSHKLTIGHKGRQSEGQGLS